MSCEHGSLGTHLSVLAVYLHVTSISPFDSFQLAFLSREVFDAYRLHTYIRNPCFYYLSIFAPVVSCRGWVRRDHGVESKKVGFPILWMVDRAAFVAIVD